MLSAAIAAAEAQGRRTRIGTPTKKAAAVAAQELGVPTDSVAALVHAYGWRWDNDGVWRRLKLGESDPVTGAAYAGPPAGGRLCATERIVVDEAGMLDQDTASALLIVAAETGASIALVGDRAQLPAVGRGGVLDIAADLASASGLEVHRPDRHPPIRRSDLRGLHPRPTRRQACRATLRSPAAVRPRAAPRVDGSDACVVGRHRATR